MTAVILQARPICLSGDAAELLAYVAEQYADGFVEPQFPQWQGGEITGWDECDQLCLLADAARLRRRLPHAMTLRFTDHQRILLTIAGELFADEYPEELVDILGETTVEQAVMILRDSTRRLIAGTDPDALFGAKGL